MNKSARLLPSFLLAATLATLFLTAARADEQETSTLTFSDATKPGTLRVAIANGDIRIHGGDGKEVNVRSDLKPAQQTQRKDGLRVLSSSTSYSFTEKNNVVTLSYGADSWPNGSGGDFEITVPRATSIVISNAIGGDIQIGGVNGDIEVKTLNGEVKLADVAGSTVVETMNGEVDCTVQSMKEGKPISVSSMNGEVRLHLPADLKANIQLRSHNGSILTDFDDKQLVTKTTTTGHRSNGHVYGMSKEDAAKLKAEIKQAIRVGMDAAREATRAAKEAIHEESASDGEKPEKPEKDDDNDNDNDNVPMAPMAPMPPLPPMVNGKIVTGMLNGGGPEIRVTTMNGDVTLRKLDEKK